MNTHGFALSFALLVLLAASAFAQDLSPLSKYHVWLPMTGFTDGQMDDARKAGYNTVMFKVHPAVSADGKVVDFSSTDKLVEQAASKGLNVLMPILGWVGLGDGRFWDTDESGNKIPNQLDPFWPEATERVEWYYGQVIDRYKGDPRVVAFAPTWGIYGEAGFTSFEAGRSQHALARFNEWLTKQRLPKLDKLPTRREGPNTEFNRFVRFRYLYIEQQFDAMITRLKKRAGGRPVGMWQEMYPVIGYLWTMAEAPAADFALYESCFTFQTNHHPEKSLGETMGLRYRCKSPSDYRDYYLPLVARKRGEGQRFMGCQLSNDYAKNYGWTEDYARQIGFDRFEDEFSPHLKKLLDAPLESPKRDVLLVFPTYAAAALSDSVVHFADAAIIDVLLRSYGVQMVRYGSPRFDKMAVRDMDRFRLIVVPDAAYLMRDTWEKLRKTKAHVLVTGCFGQALDGEQVALGESREIDGVKLSYFDRPSGAITVSAQHPLTKGLGDMLKRLPVTLPNDESFRFDSGTANVVLKCGAEPLLTTHDSRPTTFIHGHLFAAACWSPKRVPPDLGGSKDPSANEVDMWGPYDSSHPQNAFTTALMKNILDWAGVDYRVREPKPRTVCPYLGDHIEQVSISANIVYNSTASAQKITVRLPYKPKGLASKAVNGRWECELTVPAFSYVALEGPPPNDERGKRDSNRTPSFAEAAH